MTYLDNIKQAMKMLSDIDNSIFIGQSVKWKGTGLYWTLEGIPEDKRIELPVFEDVQAGMSIGLALKGYLPVSIFPRMDFIILAVNQIINHLDKMEEMSAGQFKPKVIIRTAIGSVKPLFPGVQHNQDHTDAFKSMATNIDIYKLDSKDLIIPAYTEAINSNRSSMLIEIPDMYGE